MAALAAGVSAPAGYALRGGEPEAVAVLIRGAGFKAVQRAQAGDVLLLRTGPVQLHLAIKTRRGFVHADAGLRRVVERPGEPEWEVLSIWRRLS